MKENKTLKRIITFRKDKVIKLNYEDAECSQCGKSWYFNKEEPERYGFDAGNHQFRGFVYIFHQENHGGLQLCQECFDKLKEVD